MISVADGGVQRVQIALLFSNPLRNPAQDGAQLLGCDQRARHSNLRLLYTWTSAGASAGAASQRFNSPSRRMKEIEAPAISREVT